MGLGIFHIIIANIPSSYRWLVELLGFHGDQQKGFEQLQHAATRGIYARTEASQWLSQFYQQEEEHEKALHYLDQLASSYPLNPFYGLLRGNLLNSRMRRPEDALAIFWNVLSIKNPEAERFTFSAYNSIGDVYRVQNKFPEAIKSYTMFLESTGVDTALQARARYSVGQCYELMGSRQKAIEYYASAPHIRDASERLKNPMSQEDIAIRKINNTYNAGDDDEAIRSALSLLKNRALSEDQQGRLCLIAGQAYAGKGAFDEAVKYLQMALSYRFTPESSAPRNIHYQLGMTYKKLDKKDLARGEFEKALETSEAGEEHWHKFQIERELRKLNSN
jgi:tetratricopeptide (TPR) repeat protein